MFTEKSYVLQHLFIVLKTRSVSACPCERLNAALTNTPRCSRSSLYSQLAPEVHGIQFILNLLLTYSQVTLGVETYSFITLAVETYPHTFRVDDYYRCSQHEESSLVLNV